MPRPKLVTPPAFSIFLRQNSWFFIPFLLFLTGGTILLFFIEQGDAIFFFNTHRTPELNTFFRYFTMVGEEWGYLMMMVVLLFVGYRYTLSLPVLGAVVTLTTAILKNLFRHPRPLPYFRDLDLLTDLTFVEGVHVNGSTMSAFPSGHTMAGFALFAFTAFAVRHKKGTALFLFLCAFLVGMSRIYLVQHFLKDVLLGSLTGVLLAIMIYYLQFRVQKGWLDKRLGRG